MPKRNFPAFRLCLVFALAAMAGAAAEPGPEASPSENPAGTLSREAELARLRALPPVHIPFKAAPLGGAIRLLAEACGMSYLAPSDSDFTERVTSDVRLNPFSLLQILAENYNFAFEYKEGVWRFYKVDLNELVSKSYTLRFNNLEQVSIASSSINGQLAAMGGMTGGMGGGGMGGMASGGAANAAGKSRFTTKTDKVIDDIKKILGIPTAGLFVPTLDSAGSNQGLAGKPLEAPKIEPIWNPETSQLFVVATRQQHSLIAAYLKTVDQPLKLVRIGVKFVETSRNPTQALGVDWSQTFLGSGGPITLSGASVTTQATNVSNAGTATITTANGTSAAVATGGNTGGTGTTNLNPLSAAINLNHPGNVPLPTTLLTAPAFQWTAQAIASDKYSSIVQDPVIYTSNNREVTFKATTQEPIQEGTTTIGAATAATTSQIAYIDVGTEVTILPCILPGDGANRELVQLNLAINVSSITGTQIINGNPYPVISARTYSYTVSVPSGETLAIAGLEDRERDTTENKVPIFGDIPLIGYAFKNKNDSVIHTTLLAFITPELVTADPDQAAQAAVEVPPFRHRVFQGSGGESLRDIEQSLKGIPQDIAALAAVANASNRPLVLNRLDLLEVELSLIDVRLGELRLSDHLTGRAAALVASDRGKLTAARDAVSRIATR